MEPRVAGRVIVVDPAGRVLLFRGGDPARPPDGTWWFTPGGGAAPSERGAEAARRELYEETGLLVDDLGPVVFTRDVRFSFDGETFDQRELFFVARVEPFDLSDVGWTDVERRALLEHRWWTQEELAASRAQVFPEELAEIVATLRGGELMT